MIVSIRALNVGLVVVCIVVVATLCTSLAVWSGDTALSNTQTSRDTSVKAAFDVGQSTMIKVVEDYLNQQVTSTVNQFVAFFQVQSDTTDSLVARMMTQPNVISDWDFIYGFRREFYHLVKTFSHYDGIGIVTLQHQTIQIFESELTLGKPDDAYHHFFANVNNGTFYDKPGGVPALMRAAQANIKTDGSGDVYGYPPVDDRVLPITCFGQGELALATNGTSMEPPCRTPTYNLIDIHLQLLNYLPIGASMFTPLVTIGRYVGIVSQCAYANVLTGERLGALHTGADMRKITVFLQALDLGQGSLGRVFAMVRVDWTSPGGGGQAGFIASTSHGRYVCCCI